MNGLGDGGEQSVPAFRFHRRFGVGRMNNALHGREASRGPGKRDRWYRRMAGSQVIEAVVFCLARGNEADFQCLRFYDHARDMALD
jgi:hypothetical protein